MATTYSDEKLIEIALDPTLWTDSAGIAALKERYQGDDVFQDRLHGSLKDNRAGMDPVKFGRSLSYRLFGNTEPLTRKKNTAPGKLDRFHHISNGKATGVFDYEILQHILNTQKIIVVGGVLYIYNNGVFRPDRNNTRLYSMIRKCIYPQFQKATTEKRICDLIMRTDSIQVDADDLNSYPVYWVNFQNGMYDPLEEKMVPHDPKYLAVNQIPHSYYPDRKPKGETLHRWLRFIAPDNDDLVMLLEYCGYAMTTDTRQQKFLVLNGRGGTGKSTLIRLLETVIGRDNTSHISLKELNARFASYGLMGKLLNSCADLEVSALEDTSTLKKVLGEDALRVEAKGKDSISIHNYAKLIFSTNELPLVLNEKTNGFYRRLLVLNMDRSPEKTTPDFFEKLEGDVDYFIYYCMKALHGMLIMKTIKESAGSKRAVMELRKDSDTVEAWIMDEGMQNPDARTDRVKLFKAYEQYCEGQERKTLTRNGFYRALRTKGYQEKKIGGTRVFEGLGNRGSFLGQFSGAETDNQWQHIGDQGKNPFKTGQFGAEQGAESDYKTAPLKPA